MLVTAGSYAAGNDGFSDLMLFIGSIGLLPLWLIWTGRAYTEVERHVQEREHIVIHAGRRRGGAGAPPGPGRRPAAACDDLFGRIGVKPGWSHA